VVEAAAPAEADHTVDIAERKNIAGEAQQAQMVGIAGEEMDIVGLVLLAVGDSSVLCK